MKVPTNIPEALEVQQWLCELYDQWETADAIDQITLQEELLDGLTAIEEAMHILGKAAQKYYWQIGVSHMPSQKEEV